MAGALQLAADQLPFCATQCKAPRIPLRASAGGAGQRGRCIAQSAEGQRSQPGGMCRGDVWQHTQFDLAGLVQVVRIKHAVQILLINRYPLICQ